jgi:energy-coupling factor transporter transmembrane protein EcfT
LWGAILQPGQKLKQQDSAEWLGMVETQSHGRKFVRSFLFSVKIDSPLARLHVGTKLVLILVLSIVIVRFIRTAAPDPFGAMLLLLLAFLGLYLAGVLRWVFRSYLLVVFPALLGMALTWVVFNPDPGQRVLFTIPVYSGTVQLGLSLGLGIWLFCVVGWYILRRQVFWGLVGGIVLAALVTRLVGNPALHFAQFQFFHPLEIIVSGKNLVIAVTKALGYGAMIFASLLLVMTSRDIEFTGMMMQLRIPYVAAFFVSTMLRSLSMALSDYSTIRQAQTARGILLKKRNMLQVIADLAYLAVPLTATMLRRSSEVGDAILARGFTMQTRNPTEFHEIRRFKLVDAVVLGICAVLVVATFGFGLNVTRLCGVSL